MVVDNESVQALGGRVEELAASWERQEELSALQRHDTSIEAGRPPFVPFSTVCVCEQAGGA